MRIISGTQEKWDRLEELGWCCEWCHEPTPANDMFTHRHHVLVPKRNLGKPQQEPKDGSAHIDELINIVIICRDCHASRGDDYEYGYDRQVDLYGIEEVEDFKERMLPKTHGG